MKRIGFIGAGNMATAIISGIARAGMEAELFACDHNEDKVAALAQYGVKPQPSAKELASAVDVLFLAVKPQNFAEVLAEIRGSVRPETVIVSIAAGITAQYIVDSLGIPPQAAKVVLAMPNTPLLLGCGATALSKGAGVPDDEFDFVRRIFDCAGITAVIPADRMNEIIPINGSSPAFIYQYAKLFIDYGVSVGFSEQTCLSLFAQTLIGSAKMMTESGRSIEELIRMVSSKGGTTIAGLAALEENNLPQAVRAACEKSVARAYELSK